MNIATRIITAQRKLFISLYNYEFYQVHKSEKLRHQSQHVGFAKTPALFKRILSDWLTECIAVTTLLSSSLYNIKRGDNAQNDNT